MTNEKKTKVITFRITEDDFNKIDLYCKKDKCKYSELIREAIIKFIADKEKE